MNTENASLLICNLVSSGKSLAEARKIAGENTDGGKGEKTPAPAVTGDPRMIEDADKLREALKSRNIPFHPKLGVEKLKALYQAEVLDKEPAPTSEPENPQGSGEGNNGGAPYGSGSEPGDGN